jgi:hypothetical protein
VPIPGRNKLNLLVLEKRPMKKTQRLSLLLLLGLSGLCLAQDAPPPAAPPPPPAGQAGGGFGGRGGTGGGRGNFDPAQMRERMMGMVQERIGASADEWKVISPLLQGAMDKERAMREMRGGFGGGMRRGPQGGQPGQGQAQGPEASPEVAALEKAIDSKDNAAIKTAMEALRKVRADREAEATKAKAALREVLSVSQEARLVAMGILD